MVHKNLRLFPLPNSEFCGTMDNETECIGGKLMNISYKISTNSDINKIYEFNKNLIGKKIAIIGLGVSNLPLLDYLYENKINF